MTMASAASIPGHQENSGQAITFKRYDLLRIEVISNVDNVATSIRN